MNGKTYVKFFKRIKKQTKSIYATTKKGKLRFLYQKNTTKHNKNTKLQNL